MSTEKKETMPFLSVKNLVVEYQSNHKPVYAVNGISFDLEKGKTIGLIGETGAGKTSIAKAILRILPDHATRKCQGEVYLEGVNLMELPEKEMRKLRGFQLSMIFQDPMTALNPVQTVGDQIAESVKLHNDVTMKQAKERACEMLEMVGISRDRAPEYPHQFSGGMRQRVIIAMALACNPSLLIADEPTTALDVTIQAQVIDMINDLKQKLNTSLIMITHDFGIVAETCDNVAVVYGGQIMEYGSREDIFDHLAHPYTLGLFNALPNMNKGASRLAPIPGLPVDPTASPEGCPFAARCSYATDACHTGVIESKEISAGHFCRCLHPQSRS